MRRRTRSPWPLFRGHSEAAQADKLATPTPPPFTPTQLCSLTFHLFKSPQLRPSGPAQSWMGPGFMTPLLSAEEAIFSFQSPIYPDPLVLSTAPSEKSAFQFRFASVSLEMMRRGVNVKYEVDMIRADLLRAPPSHSLPFLSSVSDTSAVEETVLFLFMVSETPPPFTISPSCHVTLHVRTLVVENAVCLRELIRERTRLTSVQSLLLL